MNEQLNGLPDENTRRFIAVLNGKIEIGRLLNALGHMTAGLINQVGSPESLCFLQYKDKDGGIHPSISHYPFIVLKADNGNQIRKVRQEAMSRSIPFTDFTHTMIVGSSIGQLQATADCLESEIDYFGICMFGETAILREFTKKFSLYK